MHRLLEAGPRGGRLVRWLLRVPVGVYGRGWGPVFGHQFLLLVHRGRKTGRAHQTALKVLTYDKETRQVIVCSAWGRHIDWLRNLEAGPAVELRIGRETFVPEHRFLTDDESFAVVLEYRKRHPWMLRVFAWVLNAGDLRSDEAARDFVRSRPFISFEPAASGAANSAAA